MGGEGWILRKRYRERDGRLLTFLSLWTSVISLCRQLVFDVVFCSCWSCCCVLLMATVTRQLLKLCGCLCWTPLCAVECLCNAWFWVCPREMTVQLQLHDWPDWRCSVKHWQRFVCWSVCLVQVWKWDRLLTRWRPWLTRWVKEVHYCVVRWVF